MQDLTSHPHHLDPQKRHCRAIIETPKGRRNKFSYDPESNLFELRGLLPEGMAFPYDFGFIPSTKGEDGDPLDVMVFMDEAAHVGCLLDLRIIGVIEAEQTENGKTVTNDRLLAVATHSWSHQDISTIEDLNESLLEHVGQFFVTYNRLRGKEFKVKAHGGPDRAIEIIQRGIHAHEKKA